MKFRTGARVAGSSQMIEVELDDSDMADMAGWDDMKFAEKWRHITKRADTLVVEYMLRNHHISEEYAAQRMQEIRQG